MSILGSLISVGGSLLGGLVGDKRNKKSQAQQNAFNLSQNDPANIREKFEAAGFNPLLGIQGWSPTQQTGFVPSSMGSAISEAAGIASQYFTDKAKEQSQLTLEKQKNAELTKLLRDSALRPRVAGVFEGRPVNAALSAPKQGSPLGVAASWLLQGEKPDREDMKNEQGMKITRFGGQEYLTPAEPDLDELLVNMAFIAPQMPSKYAEVWSDRLYSRLTNSGTDAERKARYDADRQGIALGGSLLGTAWKAGNFLGMYKPKKKAVDK